ncbi:MULTISPECIES: hypothetical protein [unclassified Bradyrhizobium]|uniref:hypothetical protein n=1 Tax=unclassified Bradyrhizobium TaxID=2631580 RepID=UPI001FF96BF7|nr:MULTISPECIES: hypothetical protein [unclassified Bradyrhizobium]MCK1267591.1 hypothetical protein [Bradyrhizobium sp. 84]MCK1374325.1 hypothetical protein [Bradyrhizobium sp. 49]MCK1413742.1 hypothetical protein [Bradyrhizobium sp. CW4]MCK1427234.1 hypothetical protein [Bradyrhizobium sp. 87]
MRTVLKIALVAVFAAIFRKTACAGHALVAVLVFLGAPNAATASEVFSIRCETEAPARPYFVTFDLGAQSVAFETPPADVTSYSGINLRVGAVTSEAADSKITFFLQVVSGRIDLVFDRDRNMLIWPGLDDSSLRPTLYHSCKAGRPRSVLDFRLRDPVKDPISIRCEDADAIFFTMDVAAKRVLFERGESGRTFEGAVVSVKDDEIAIDMQFDSRLRIKWDRGRGTISFDNGAGRPNTVMQCRTVSQRTLMVYYKRLWKRIH